MIILGILTLLLIVADFFLLGKFLKIDKGKKLYILFAVKAIVNIAGCLLLAWKCPNTVYSYMMICFISLLTLISIEDAHTMKIDKLFSWILLALGALTSFSVPDTVFWKVIAFSAVIGLIMYLFSVKSKEAVGKGDVICVMAATMCFSFNNVFSMMIYTLLSSLVFGIIQLIMKKINMKQGMPFVPFLVLGICLTLFFM